LPLLPPPTAPGQRVARLAGSPAVGLVTAVAPARGSCTVSFSGSPPAAEHPLGSLRQVPGGALPSAVGQRVRVLEALRAFGGGAGAGAGGGGAKDNSVLLRGWGVAAPGALGTVVALGREADGVETVSVAWDGRALPAGWSAWKGARWELEVVAAGP
jgi:hypothetical protein